MSNLTATSSAPSAPPAADRGARRPRLSGMIWLVWRQHRAGFWTLLALAALAVAWMLYQRAGLLDHLAAKGWPASGPDTWMEGISPYSTELLKAGYGLGFVPVLLGVFLGAPLLAGDLESGTAKLVTTQAARPARWLAAKIGISALVVVVCTVTLSFAFGRWWAPVSRQGAVLDWTSGQAFDNTGPVPVALALFTVIGGVAIGLLLRRTLIAMVVTFFFAVAVQLVWSASRLDLGHVSRITTDTGVDVGPPNLPASAHQVDMSYVTGSGDTLGWSTCVHAGPEKAVAACQQQKGIVGWALDYLPISQMSGMQWLGASILFALTAAVTAFVFLWGRKRVA
ncbi:ABC transporter [Streptomyces sp. NBC_01217]|uniref:ABC transporter n=1 Tax=Streptomyces sp. NBC_01217 TaxID=2903779 RepID=UPI002E10F66A|nr:ABC transporter [Streptomyces sp. NBC_01217]